MTQADIGLIGLGTMGAALALNIADNGFDVAVWNRTTSVTHEFNNDAGYLASKVHPHETLESLISGLSKPRAIILMVPAGDPVDQQIAALRPIRPRPFERPCARLAYRPLGRSLDFDRNHLGDRRQPNLLFCRRPQFLAFVTPWFPASSLGLQRGLVRG